MSNRNLYRLRRYYAIMEKELRDPFCIVYMTRAKEYRHLTLDREMMILPIIKAVSRFVSGEVAEP